jgi:hypothetical protein
MKSKIIYFCGKCNREFDSEYFCQEHEKECGVLHSHICDKCGKETKYSKDRDVDHGYTESSLWTFTPNHYRAGYGSKLDGSEFVLHLCDDCLCEFVTSCVHVERIRNSGSNTYYDYPDDYEDEYLEADDVDEGGIER